MNIIHNIHELAQKQRRSVVTIGVFDGIHRGHQAVLSQLQSRARLLGCDAVVLTFKEHPKKHLGAEAVPPLITSFDHKIRLLEKMGIDIVVPLDYERIVPSLSAVDFIQRYLIQGLRAREIVVGEDWHFGKDREGTIDLLQRICAQHDVTVFPVPHVMLDDVRVNSTNIRKFILAGELDAVRMFLGRSYSVLGTVVSGQTLGRRIGYPTANVNISNEALPPSGVYAVWIDVDTVVYPGILNIGIRPTVKQPAEVHISVEVHIFDFDRMIYGHTIEVFFVEKMREEMYFSDITLLKQQIQKDEQTARELFAKGANYAKTSE